MAAKKEKPAKSGRSNKALRGRMPSKRTINLVLIDENKISPVKAAIGIIVIVILAALFSKFLVADRLVAMTASAGRAAKLKSDLAAATGVVRDFGDVETTYAHYTYAGMTQAELNLVDRTRILGLVGDTLPKDPSAQTVNRFAARLGTLIKRFKRDQSKGMTLDDLNSQVLNLVREILPPRYGITSWSVTGNLLTVEVTGNTLRTLNNLARQLERSPIVDSCSIITANRDKQVEVGGEVRARLIVYLQQPSESAEEEVSAS